MSNYWREAGLGERPDPVIAEEMGMSLNAVRYARKKLGIPSYESIRPRVDPAIQRQRANANSARFRKLNQQENNPLPVGELRARTPRKKCADCRLTKSSKNFAICRSIKDGLSTRCKLCRNRVVRKQHLARNYSLTPEDFSRMLKAQGKRCLICNSTFGTTRRSMCVDHDHGTGKVRGILCVPCNTGLGCFGDDPILIKKAFRYLLT